MRPAPSSLISFLLSKQPFWVADLFTITLLGGSIYRWTSAEIPLSVDGNVYTSAGPLLQRSGWNMENTVVIPELDISLYAGNDSSYDVGGVNVKLFLHNGGFDGARVKLARAFMPVTSTYGDTSIGTVEVFNGRMGAIDITDTGANLKVMGDIVIFNQTLPHNIFQTSCLHTLFDSGCTMLAADFNQDGTVVTGSSTSVINWTSGIAGNASFLFGYIIMTSGATSGTRRTIKATSSSTLRLAFPLPATPSAGDTFTAYFGCDKTPDTCTNRFSNLEHYRGFPYVPDASLAV